MSDNEKTLQIAVFGLGYVGCVSAACLASLGFRVVGIDRDEHKIRSVLSGASPFYEPGLEDLIRENVAQGRLSATSSTEEALRDADVALVCVGTPSEKNGNLGLDQIRRVVEDIRSHLAGRSKRLIVAIRSTVFPGTCEEVVIPGLDSPLVSVVSNPEFLREGVAVKDFFEPSLIVVGGSDRDAVEAVGSLYAKLPFQPCLVSLRTAEMIKYACNAFHAVKIAFANEIGALSSRLGVDGLEVMDTLCQDTRLNISKAYLKPGFAFGGSCLPKDLRALVYRASRLDLELPLLFNSLPSNDRHLDRAVEDVLNAPAKRIGVFGLAFKEDTDDLRESPVIRLLEQLIGKGRDVRVFDPHIRLDEIYGTNRSFVMNALPHIGKLMQPTLEEVIGWADCLVVAQKPSKELSARIETSSLPVIDLVGARLTRTPEAASAQL